MNLQDKIKEFMASQVGKECEFDGGVDTIEEVSVKAIPFSSDFAVIATLKYAGDANAFDIEIK